MARVYAISGLGADERVFKHLEDLGLKFTHLPWVEIHENDTIESYAARYWSHYELPESAQIVGLSFGGMVGAEMAKAHEHVKLVQISSALHRSDLPGVLKIPGLSKLNAKFPHKMLSGSPFINHAVFGIKGDENKEVLDAILKDMDFDFFKNAANAILNWKGVDAPINVKRIHGSTDLILPPIKGAYDKLMKGGHFMLMDDPETVAAFLREHLQFDEN